MKTLKEVLKLHDKKMYYCEICKEWITDKKKHDMKRHNQK